MAGRCACAGCTTGANGAYVRLLHSAQADPDQAHRQQAMDRIALIAPLAGGSNLAADAAAATILATLYPEPQQAAAEPSIPPAVAALLAETYAKALALIGVRKPAR